MRKTKKARIKPFSSLFTALTIAKPIFTPFCASGQYLIINLLFMHKAIEH